MPPTYIVSIKAFGDFVIASSFLPPHAEAIHPHPLRILAGEHLRPLVLAMGLEARVDILASGSKYPPAFDVRSQGLAAALRSLLALRRQFQSVPRDWRLLFDRLGMREKYVGGSHEKAALNPAPNIYLAYQATLRATRADTAGPPATSNSAASKIRIVPSSRVAAKRIPLPVLTAAITQLQNYGDCEIIDMPGEEMELPRSTPIKRIERSFTALLDALRGSRLVVSADSLSAHLAETLRIPSYVVTPWPNEYWLPLQAFQSHAWCTFQENHRLQEWLKRHLAVG